MFGILESAGLLCCILFLTACSRPGFTGQTRAPIPIPDTRSEQPLDTEPASQAEQVYPETLPPEQELLEEFFADDYATAVQLAVLPAQDDFLSSLNTEIPAVQSEDFSQLDELIELSLPPVPRELTDEERLLHTPSQLPLVLNDAVKRLINYFTTSAKGMATMRNSLGYGNAYKAMIKRILEEEDIPEEFFYLAMAESGFKPTARSHMSATGMWQFMSSRGRQYGLKQDRYVDLRYDPETATRAAARHLKDLYIEFNDWYLAMAAYNSGPNRVSSAIRRTGSRDYWELVRKRQLPRETRNYVPIILAMTFVGKNLDIFDLGKKLDPAPVLQYNTIQTDVETSFALIADITGSTISEIKDLNPALLRSATPPYMYDLRLPRDGSDRYAQKIAKVPADKRLNWRSHEVRTEETLEAFAKRHKVTVAQLASANSIPATDTLQAGLNLVVPTTTKLQIYRYYGARAGGLLEPGTGRYRIAGGDTLGGISRRFRVSIANLMAWNGLANSRIRAGRYLIVQPDGLSPVASSGGQPTGRYTVRSGDSLSRIGTRFGVSVSQLKAWNRLRSSTIRIGQSLKVPGPAPRSSPAPVASNSRTTARSQAPAGSGQYRIQRGNTLSTIAERFGVSIANLRSWNSIRGNRITAGKFLVVRPPSRSPAPGPTRTTTARAGTQPRTSSTSGSTEVRYTVRRGDSLGAIAERYNVTAAKLRAWNGLRGSIIFPGQTLLVKQQPASRSSTSAAAPQAATQQPSARQPVSPGATTYLVRSGDSLGAIAERYNVTAAKLRAWNGLRGSNIYPGQKLEIRPSAAGSTATVAVSKPVSSSSSAATYRVRSGDNLESIARRHGVTIASLKRWNNLSSSRIYAGQNLLVREGGSTSQRYRIQQGDTLEAIAGRFRVSIQDLKDWNGLRNSRIRAGNYLTIRSSGS